MHQLVASFPVLWSVVTGSDSSAASSLVTSLVSYFEAIDVSIDTVHQTAKHRLFAFIANIFNFHLEAKSLTPSTTLMRWFTLDLLHLVSSLPRDFKADVLNFVLHVLSCPTLTLSANESVVFQTAILPVLSRNRISLEIVGSIPAVWTDQLAQSVHEIPGIVDVATFRQSEDYRLSSDIFLNLMAAARGVARGPGVLEYYSSGWDHVADSGDLCLVIWMAKVIRANKGEPRQDIESRLYQECINGIDQELEQECIDLICSGNVSRLLKGDFCRRDLEAGNGRIVGLLCEKTEIESSLARKLASLSRDPVLARRLMRKNSML